MRIGVDTGGTFTDFVLWDGKSIRTKKIRSTPADPSEAILAGVETAREIVHGSTVATNALLERRGVRTAFVSTAGFEDILAIGRQNRASLYDWFSDPPQPLAPSELCFGLPERTLHDGSIDAALPPDAVERLAADLRLAGVESVAVCLLHSYANPEHERLVGKALRQAGLCVSLSHEILPEYREYERASTTAVNAYVSPPMTRYLDALDRQVGASRLRVFQSNGGSISARMAGSHAVHTVLSGPAGGVQGAAAAAKAAGFARVISFDMGGTSTDVSLYDRRPTYTTEAELGGCPIRVSMLDIHSVGAGGGSVAWIDSGGALRVGPRSAGAVPGPVCYGEGEEVTVTDANLLLGRIDPDAFLSGRMTLDVARAARYLEKFAGRAGVDAAAMAQAIVDVANSNMERAIRKISVERGHDPRDFALLSFGGAGGQHACALAERLDIRSVIVPKQAGVLSALGMLTADFSRDYSVDIPAAGAEAAFEQLESLAAAELRDEGFDEVLFERSVDLRYRGQSFEITVPWRERDDFHAAHQRLYGYARPDGRVEAVAARVQAVGVSQQDAFDLAAPSDEQSFSSLYVPDGWSRREDRCGNVILRRG